MKNNFPQRNLNCTVDARDRVLRSEFAVHRENAACASRSTDTARTLPPPEETRDSVFAALDTDSNRVLDEREWQSDEARNMANLKNIESMRLASVSDYGGNTSRRP